MDRALIFCTAHLQSDPSRYQLWAEYYSRVFDGQDIDLLAVNDGLCNLSDGLTQAELLVLDPHLGRPSHFVFPGWKRSFAHALRTAMDRRYRWIGHIESDLYIKPNAVQEFITHLHRDDGFGSGWCRTYGFPESSLLVLNDRRVNQILLDRYSGEVGWNEGIDFEQMIWTLGPGKILEGDRYEGRIERLRPDDTYIAAIHFQNVREVEQAVRMES